MFGDVTVSSRPLRLAFLIKPTNEEFLKAVQLNSTLWGGTFNPIIPLYRRVPKTWRRYPREKISVSHRVLGYLRAFDPDIIVDVSGEGLPSYVAGTERFTIKSEEIWSSFPHDEMPKYGIGIFELLAGIYQKHFEQVRRFPYKIVIPILPKAHRLLWGSLYGELPIDFRKFATTHFVEALDIEEPVLDPLDFHAIIAANSFTPRHITKFEISRRHAGRVWRDACAFFFDADHLGDLIDLWNLRALGRPVLPLPRQYAFEANNIAAAREFVKEHFRISRHNADLMYGTHIICGQSATMPEIEDFAKALDMTKHMPSDKAPRAIALQHWFPRIWDEWAIAKDAATPDQISSKSEDYSFQDSDGSIAVPVVEPKFEIGLSHSDARYANDISLRFYGENQKTLAGILPFEHGKEVLRVAGNLTALTSELRIGRSGLVHLCSWRSKIRLTVPLAEDVFFAWLKDKGYSAELSTCGLLAKQISANLRGWIYALSNEPFLDLLDRMNKGGDESRGAAVGEVKNALKKISPDGRFYQSLSERGVFQLGFRSQCPVCRRASWYSIRELKEELTCPLCHEQISALSAIDTHQKGTWHLKTAGPFSVGNHADGSYSVLLTHNLFQQDHSLETTPVLSFKAASKSGKNIEADYAMLWRETSYGETEEGVLFAECKSYNYFDKKDFERMKILANEFSGAILAFCTLRRELTPKEVKAITRVANVDRKYWKPERPINPVLILTGNELFGFEHPPFSWRDKAVPEWTKNVNTLLDLCNATEAIYLGLPHWGEQWRKDFEKRKARRDSKKRAA